LSPPPSMQEKASTSGSPTHLPKLCMPTRRSDRQKKLGMSLVFLSRHKMNE
jgi:hypothetical protein